MKIVRYAALPLVGIAFAATPALAASDVSNSPSTANTAVASIAAPVAASQTASLIAGGATAGISGGGFGGFGAGGTGGFGAGGTGVGPTTMNTRQMGKAGAAGPAKMGLWAQGNYANIDKSEVGLQMDGNVYAFVGGIDYKFNDRGVAGLSVGYENTDIDTKFNNGKFEGNGITVAPYVGYALTPNWSVDASVGHTWVDYDVSRNNDTAKGSYEASRWFGAANLTGAYAVDRWRLSPKVGVLYLKESADDYTETGAAAAGLVKGTVTTFGRASAGLKAGYAFDNFMPYGRVTGEWDFNKSNEVLKSNGQLSNVDSGGLALALGVDIFSGPVSGTVEVGYDSALRDDLDVWKGTARIRYDF